MKTEQTWTEIHTSKHERTEMAGDLFVIVKPSDWKWLKEEEEEDERTLSDNVENCTI